MKAKEWEPFSAIQCVFKAIDRVGHQGLLHKLKQIGITGGLLECCSEYLPGRVQRVVLSGASSKVLPLKAGVPQYSIIGPLLVTICLIDIVQDWFYYSSLCWWHFIIFDNLLLAAESLNVDFQKQYLKYVTGWLQRKGTQSLLISQKVNKPYHPPLFVNYVQISEVFNHKLLGVSLASALEAGINTSRLVNWKPGSASICWGVLDLF